MTQTTWISIGVLAIATSSPTVAHAADYALTFDLEQPADQVDSLPNFSATAAAPSAAAPLQPAVSDSAANVLPPVPPGAEQLLASSDLSREEQQDEVRSRLDSDPSRSTESSGSVGFDVDTSSQAAPSESKVALTPAEVRQNPQFQALFQDTESQSSSSPPASPPVASSSPSPKPSAPAQPKPPQSEPSTTFSAPNLSARPYQNLDSLFEGGSESLVARSVGSAEGTRRPDGGYNPAYHGHTDPGNGVWNMGSFSYQHGASSPDEADRKQLNRLKNQAIELRQKAATYQIQLDLEEELNGIDLANQAPLAALGREGYIDRLAQAYQMGLLGSEAILWARVRSFINPDTGQWNAPGLGNTLDGITHDQNRRQTEIKKAIDADPLVKQWKGQ
ncbi:MAG: hypothetical protein ACTS2F_11925 [Thainema sp.]